LVVRWRGLEKISTDLPGLPESLKRIDGNIVVVLSERESISFAAASVE
jgi:hypothetical protein